MLRECGGCVVVRELMLVGEIVYTRYGRSTAVSRQSPYYTVWLFLDILNCFLRHQLCVIRISARVTQEVA